MLPGAELQQRVHPSSVSSRSHVGHSRSVATQDGPPAAHLSQLGAGTPQAVGSKTMRYVPGRRARAVVPLDATMIVVFVVLVSLVGSHRWPHDITLVVFFSAALVLLIGRGPDNILIVVIFHRLLLEPTTA